VRSPAAIPILLTALLIAVALPAVSSAAETPRIDPEAGSPSDAIYGIPLEEARRDAAFEEAGSAIRSENGVGSSTRVPGLGPSDALDRRRQREAALGPKGSKRGGRPLPVPDPRPRRLKPIAASAVEPAPSALASVTLIVLTILVAGAAGVFLGRRSRTATGG